MAVSSVESTSTLRDQRRREVEEAVYGARMKGPEGTPELTTDAEAYVNGPIDGDEFGAAPSAAPGSTTGILLNLVGPSQGPVARRQG